MPGEFSDLILGVGLKEFLFANVSEAENEVGRFSGTESLAGIIIKVNIARRDRDRLQRDTSRAWIHNRGCKSPQSLDHHG